MGHMCMRNVASWRSCEDPALSHSLSLSLSLCDPCFGELGPVGEMLDSTFVLWEHQKRASNIPETPAPSSQWENWANGSVVGLWASTPERLDQ